MLVKIDVFGVKKGPKRYKKVQRPQNRFFDATLTFFWEARDGGTRWPAVGSAGQIVKISGTLKYQNCQNPYNWKLFGEKCKCSLRPQTATPLNINRLKQSNSQGP